MFDGIASLEDIVGEWMGCAFETDDIAHGLECMNRLLCMLLITQGVFDEDL